MLVVEFPHCYAHRKGSDGLSLPFFLYSLLAQHVIYPRVSRIALQLNATRHLR